MADSLCICGWVGCIGVKKKKLKVYVNQSIQAFGNYKEYNAREWLAAQLNDKEIVNIAKVELLNPT